MSIHTVKNHKTWHFSKIKITTTRVYVTSIVIMLTAISTSDIVVDYVVVLTTCSCKLQVLCKAMYSYTEPSTALGVIVYTVLLQLIADCVSNQLQHHSWRTSVYTLPLQRDYTHLLMYSCQIITDYTQSLLAFIALLAICNQPNRVLGRMYINFS